MLPESCILMLLSLIKQGAVKAVEFLIQKITQFASSVAGVDFRVLLVNID